MSELHPQTRAIRGGREYNDTALAPVLWASSTFVAETVEEAHKFATDVTAPKFYGRHANPTTHDFERAIADLEGAEAAKAFASGMGAVSATILASAPRVITSSPVAALLPHPAAVPGGVPAVRDRRHLRRRHRAGAFESAIVPGKTSLVFAETPANPKLALVDLAELGAIAGPMTVVDSTFATPLGQRPLDHGVDLVIHSATKAIAGAQRRDPRRGGRQ